MNNTYIYNRMLAEDVQTAELHLEYNTEKKGDRQLRARKPIVNKKEQLAEAVWAEMQARKEGRGVLGLKMDNMVQAA